MTPGPSEPEPEVLAALALPILPHYGAKWKELYDDTTSKLRKIFRTTKNDVILVPVPGQLAVEMAVANLVPTGQKAFVCVNGYFSEMLVSMIEYWGGSPVRISKPWGTAVTAEDVKAVLDGHADLTDKALFVVHNETSTGVKNPVEDILRVCEKRGMIGVLDSISAFGGMDIRVDEWKADYAIGYASKALGGVFGIQPIALSDRIWEISRRNSKSIHTRYLNLNVWEEAFEEMRSWGHPHPSSMPTSLVVGLRKATELVLQEGLEARYQRHREAAAFAREQLRALQLQMYPPDEIASDTITAVRAAPEWEAKLRSELVSRFDIMVSGGLGRLQGRLIRIGHMGTSAKKTAIATTVAAMRTILEDPASGFRPAEVVQVAAARSGSLAANPKPTK
jgi:alanine-glyoxylate transaminase/serine-glyoxylate transaminase/serine-pyruvate transaminase